MKKTTAQFAIEIKDKWGLHLTSEYIGAGHKVTFNCINGHINSTLATNVLQRGYNCKECKVGYYVTPKLNWSDSTIQNVLIELKTKTTKEVAEIFKVTISSINNMLAKENISNPRDRHKEDKLIAKLTTQNRTLVDIQGNMANIMCINKHKHKQEISNILSHNTGCPTCFNVSKTSKIEHEVQEFINSVYSGWTIYNDRSILEGKELDIVLPDIGIALEINGTYWHSEEKVGLNYHMNKTNAVEAYGYQLIHIKDYDWYNNKEIVKSIISSKLGLNKKVHARKCTVKSIEFPRQFLSNNHIQGPGQPTSNNLGLFLNNELLAVATFSKPRFSDEADLELVRFCTKLNTTVVGGLSKLLSKVEGTLLSYANRDYSIGKAYEAVGFKLIRTTSPGLEYYNRYIKISRYKAQSIEDLSEYTKYYNSGNLVYLR